MNYNYCMTMVGMPLLIIMVKCGIFPNSVNDIIIVIGEKEYRASSFDELISLKIDDKTLINIMDEIEVQYY